jgi:Zn-dependent M28 family amino/carboxypeptidase
MDQLTSFGETNDLVVVGYGHSELDAYAEETAKAQNRFVTPDQEPEKGYYFRSDHFNFAKVGIPALYGKSGKDHREKGAEYGKQMQDDFIANKYHKPSDEFDPAWDASGVAQDAAFFYSIGKRLASETTFPKWNENSEFKNARKE